MLTLLGAGQPQNGKGTEERFVISVKTDNTGTSNDDQFTLPWIGTYDVNWGDGTSDSGVTDTQTHTYASPGTYDVKVTATTGRIYFNNSGDKSKLLDIKNWGTCEWSNLERSFMGCDNLDISAVDIPNLININSTSNMLAFCTSLIGNNSMGLWDVSNVTSMPNMFYRCALFNIDISAWDMSNVTNIVRMFYMNGVVSSFNQPIGNWDVGNLVNAQSAFESLKSFNYSLGDWDISNVTNLRGLFEWTPTNTGMDVSNYNDTLIKWAAQTPQNNVQAHFGNFKYSYEAAAARQTLIDTYGWTITDGGQVASPEFVISVKTDNSGTSANNQFTLPWVGTYDVDWGDGNQEIGVTNTQTHSYASAGTYDVAITATTGRISFNNSGDKSKLLDIKNWGTCQWTTMSTAFRGCTSLTGITATDAPNLSNTTDLSFMFWRCSLSNADFSNWDVSNITNISLMFSANGANGTINLSNWDVSNVTNMYAMFYDCNTLQITGIDNWDTDSLVNIQQMFKSTSLLDVSFANWNINSITNLSGFLSGNLASQPVLSTTNYDGTLISWAAQTPQQNRNVSFGGSQYTLGGAAEAARNTLINTYGWTITDGGGLFVGVLDTYPNASAAYSLRDLASASIGSAVVRVRRSSDNTEQDFTSSEITDGTLTTFTGANDGFVTTWYDQSGNSSNATQATANEQPKLVSSGVVELDNGKPCIIWDNINDRMQINTSYSGNNLLSIFSVYNKTSPNPSDDSAYLVFADASLNVPDGVLAWRNIGNIGSYRSGAHSVNGSISYDTQVNSNFIYTSTQVDFYNNSSLIGSKTTSNAIANFDYTFIQIGRTGGNTSFKNQELIIYQSDQSSNRTGIETNINTEYTIY